MEKRKEGRRRVGMDGREKEGRRELQGHGVRGGNKGRMERNIEKGKYNKKWVKEGITREMK